MKRHRECSLENAAERQWLFMGFMTQWWMLSHDATIHGTMSKLLSIQAPFVRHASEIEIGSMLRSNRSANSWNLSVARQIKTMNTIVEVSGKNEFPRCFQIVFFPLFCSSFWSDPPPHAGTVRLKAFKSCLQKHGRQRQICRCCAILYVSSFTYMGIYIYILGIQ